MITTPTAKIAEVSFQFEEFPETSPPTNKCRGYLSLIAGCLIQLTIGSFYSYGNLVPYFASYLAYTVVQNQDLNEDELITIYNKQISKIDWIYGVIFVTFPVGIYLGGYLEIRYGQRKTFIISSLLMSFGFGLSFFSLKYGGENSLLWCIITLGIMWSFGMSIAYPTLVLVGFRWFPNKHGLISGICYGFIGAGGILWDIIQEYLINPQNIEFDKNIGYVRQPEIIARIPFMCVYIGVIMACMQFISIVCISNPPWFENNITFSVAATADDAYEKNIILPTVIDQQSEYSLNAVQAMKFPSFWILFIESFFYTLIVIVLTLQWKVFAVSHLNILDDEYLSIVGSFSSLSMVLGCIFWGVFYDWVNQSYIITQILISTIMTFFIVTWTLCSHAPYAMFPIWDFFLWFNVNCLYVILPSVIAETFGTKYVASIYGCMLVSQIFSTLFIVAIISDIYSLFGGWSQYLMVIGAFGVCTIVLANVFTANIDRKKYLMELHVLKYEMSERKRLMGSESSSVWNYNYSTLNQSMTLLR